ncbi:MAG: acyl-CoA dehydrogenase family protein, partial [Desulfovibrionales bacterium]|nr:acyl-CoA dehydrogenase family protein [Desulfovibrionales bacterium]
MAHTFLSMRNLKFTLHTKVEALGRIAPDVFQDRDEKSMDRVLDAAFELAKKKMYPIHGEMDKRPPVLEKGEVKIHPSMGEILEILGRDGWMSAVFPEEWGGEELPASLSHCIHFIFGAANYSASVFSGLTCGAARLILNFASPEAKGQYLPPMLVGKWQGTMALT